MTSKGQRGVDCRAVISNLKCGRNRIIAALADCLAEFINDYCIMPNSFGILGMRINYEP